MASVFILIERMAQSWINKTNPYEQARSTFAIAWHKKSEVLAFKCTTTEKKRKDLVTVFVTIAHGHVAVMCDQYEKQLTGQFLAHFV